MDNHIYRQLLFVAAILLMPHLTLAGSGACSNHGGVDCSVGPGSNGNVVCNDGWTGSSVSYYSSTGCNVPPPVSHDYCTPPSAIGCTQQIEIDSYQQICDQLKQSTAANYYREGGTGTAPDSASNPSCQHAQLCAQQVTAFNVEKSSYNQCEKNRTNTTIQQSQQSQNTQQGNIDGLMGQLQQSQAKMDQLNLNKSCNDALATYNQTSSKCECETGYIYTDSKCVTSQDEAEKVLTQVIASSSTQVVRPSSVIPKQAQDLIVAGMIPAVTPAANSVLKGFTIGNAKALTSTTSASSTIAVGSSTSSQHKSSGFLSRAYGFIGSFFSFFQPH